jgi:translation elongation factor P/translation initiation factor 5A
MLRRKIMSKELKAGQKINIDGRQFTVIDMHDKDVFGVRKTTLTMQALEDPEDVKPEDAKPATSWEIPGVDKEYALFLVEKFKAAFMEGLIEGLSE